MKRWIVRPGEGPTIDAILRALGDPGACAQGRAFLGKKRVSRPDHPVRPGDEVVVHAPRAATDDAPSLLAERDGVVAVSKPASLPTVADHRGDRCLLAWAQEKLGCVLHTTSRLDVGVSGVVLLTRTQQARERLAAAREAGSYLRQYAAVATGTPALLSGRWDGAIGRAADPRLRAVGGHDAVHAATRYRAVASLPSGHALLALEPETGRTHQLRVHAAHAGLPLVGDAAYGGPTRIVASSGAIARFERVALHARRVRTPDGAGAPWQVEAPVPDELRQLWQRLGGAASDWDFS